MGFADGVHQNTSYIYDLSDINNLKTCIVYDSVPYWRGNSIRYKLIPLTGIKIAIIVFFNLKTMMLFGPLLSNTVQEILA